MKKFLTLLVLSVLIVLNYGCKKDDDSGTDPEPQKTYKVVYTMEVNENHLNSKVSWIALNNERQEESNPAYPWTKEYTGLKSGDSVAISFEIENMPDLKLSYSWMATVTAEGYSYENGDSYNYTSGNTVTKKHSWGYKIP